jgi:hypothetical protein
VNWLLQLFGYHAPAPVVPPASSVCVRCDGRSGHPVIDGEGAAICMPCLYRNGRAAADPSRLTSAEAELLLTAHGDVVSLVRVDVGFTAFWRCAWREVDAA